MEAQIWYGFVCVSVTRVTLCTWKIMLQIHYGENMKFIHVAIHDLINGASGNSHYIIVPNLLLIACVHFLHFRSHVANRLSYRQWVSTPSSTTATTTKSFVLTLSILLLSSLRKSGHTRRNKMMVIHRKQAVRAVNILVNMYSTV